MKCQVLKLRSGEEIICNLSIISKTKYEVHNPYIFKYFTTLDPINGFPCDITTIKDWLSLSNIKKITIPANHVVGIFNPTAKSRSLYKNEIETSKILKKHKKGSSDCDKSVPLGPPSMNNDEDLKKFLENLFTDFTSGAQSGGENDLSDSSTPEDEFRLAQDTYNDQFPPRKRNNKNQHMIQMSMIFPPEVLIDLMETGLINVNDVFKIAKEVKKKLKYTGDERHRPDFGNKMSDWNPDLNTEDYK